jgi:ParB/RepB/Spo0J family partition protein
MNTETSATAEIPEIETLADQAWSAIQAEGKASTSFIQRRLRLGYTKACTVLEVLEKRGLIGPGEGTKPREILVKSDGAELPVTQVIHSGPHGDIVGTQPPPADPEPLPPGVDQLISVDRIDPSPWNRKGKGFSEESLAEMESSIRSHGILQRVTVRPHPANDPSGSSDTWRYQLVFGERRWRGACRVDPKYLMPCTVRPLSDRQTLELQKIENLQREDLDPIEEGKGLRQMQVEFGYSIDDLVAQLGRSKSHIYGRIKLGNLCDKAAEAYRAGIFYESAAIRIARLPSETMQLKLIQEVVEQHSYDSLEEMLKDSTREEGITERDIGWLINNHFIKQLKGAPFDPKLADLVPVLHDEHSQRIAGGACTDCPFRSGNQPDFDPKTSRADMCQNLECYRLKCDAMFVRRTANPQEKGGAVLTHAEQVFDEDGWIKSDSPLQRGDNYCYEVDGQFGQLAKKLKVAPVLAMDPRSGETINLYDKSAVLAAAKAAGVKVRTSLAGRSGLSDAEKKARKEQQRGAAILSHVSGELIALASAPAKAEKALRYIAEQLADDATFDAARFICRRRGIDLKQYKRPNSYTQPARIALKELAKTVDPIELLFELAVTGRFPNYGNKSRPKEAAKAIGADYAKLESGAKADLSERAEKKGKKAKPKPAKSPAKAKGKTKRKAAAK